jgi:hypothetical protein
MQHVAMFSRIDNGSIDSVPIAQKTCADVTENVKRASMTLSETTQYRHAAPDCHWKLPIASSPRKLRVTVPGTIVNRD